tara:strand:- start:847 stop:1101 length:255 start_codon:yes stop_codon:yes gene_type:complete
VKNVENNGKKGAFADRRLKSRYNVRVRNEPDQKGKKMTSTTTTTSTFEYRRLTEVLGFTHAEAMKTIENRREQDRRVRNSILNG